MKQSLFFLFVLISVICNVYAKTTSIRHGLIESDKDHRSRYILDLLQLSLEKTQATHGPYELISVDLGEADERYLDSVKKNKWVDIAVSISTTSLEEDLLPIRIPLLKGLIGYRFFIINLEDKEKFDSIESLEELKNLKAGQQKHWPDTEILRENNFPVITTTDYPSLFKMLKKRRFDYFPRSIVEILGEVQSHDDLTIIDNIALYYPAAFYFFVNKNNTALAERIETGLRLALTDGSFDETLLKEEGIKWAYDKIKENNNRKVFKLKNPLLPSVIPLQAPEIWYSPNI